MATKEQLGIGDIVMSVLGLAKFQAQHGGGKDDWVPCDGKEHPNSEYSRVTGTGRVPDLVGRYPRGYKQGLTPDPGEHQEGAVLNHRHDLEGDGGGHNNSGTWGVMNDAQGGGDNQVARFGYAGSLRTTGVSTGSNDETRPLTTVVNFYIRIN
jgi:hypothetical protein